MSTNRLKFTDKETWKLVLFSPYSIFNPFVKLVIFFIIILNTKS